jgi:penicillin-insensitive murein endopeptidase
VRAVFTGILGALLTLAPPHVASPAVRRSASLGGAANAAGRALSIGSPNGGRLDGGARLVETPYLRVVPFYKESNARWGLPGLVELIDRAGRQVAHRFPGAVLSVGDLSRRGGGELDRHHSHESGRDADVGFYLRNTANKPLLTAAFVSFAPSGTATSMRGALFDESRNWALVEALVEDPAARISFIFVAAHIRARLLRYAEQNGVARSIRERAAEVMMQPRRAPHDDHFHVRIACPSSQHGTCVEDAIVLAPRAHAPASNVRRRNGSDDGTRKPPISTTPAGPSRAPSPLATAAPETEPSAAGPFENTRVLEPTSRTTSNGETSSPRPLANAVRADSLSY